MSLQLFYFLSTISLLSTATINSGESCEHSNQPISINCGNQVIDITFASYGIYSTDNTCKKKGDCPTAPTSMEEVKIKCQGEHSCSVMATNNIFGDPCKGTEKYLIVNWRCLDLMEGEACEHSNIPLRMNCGNARIDVVSAAYGLKDNTNTCGLTGNCSPAASSLRKVKERCQGRPSCSVMATNTIFGDPCKGTRKYLRATWSCVPPVDTMYSGESCEHSDKPINIDCQNRLIDIVFASYGLYKSANNSCNLKGSCPTSENSLQEVKKRCQDRLSCSILASNSIFGDPCKGTRKYLYVNWRCLG